MSKADYSGLCLTAPMSAISLCRMTKREYVPYQTSEFGLVNPQETAISTEVNLQELRRVTASVKEAMAFSAESNMLSTLTIYPFTLPQFLDYILMNEPSTFCDDFARFVHTQNSLYYSFLSPRFRVTLLAIDFSSLVVTYGDSFLCEPLFFDLVPSLPCPMVFANRVPPDNLVDYTLRTVSVDDYVSTQLIIRPFRSREICTVVPEAPICLPVSERYRQFFQSCFKSCDTTDLDFTHWADSSFDHESARDLLSILRHSVPDCKKAGSSWPMDSVALELYSRYEGSDVAREYASHHFLFLSIYRSSKTRGRKAPKYLRKPSAPVYRGHKSPRTAATALARPVRHPSPPALKRSPRLNADNLILCGLVIRDRSHLAEQTFDYLFGRNRGLRAEMLSSPLPLSSFQPRLSQKLSSDSNFASRARLTHRQEMSVSRDLKRLPRPVPDFSDLLEFPPLRSKVRFQGPIGVLRGAASAASAAVRGAPTVLLNQHKLSKHRFSHIFIGNGSNNTSRKIYSYDEADAYIRMCPDLRVCMIPCVGGEQVPPGDMVDMSSPMDPEVFFRRVFPLISHEYDAFILHAPQAGTYDWPASSVFSENENLSAHEALRRVPALQEMIANPCLPANVTKVADFAAAALLVWNSRTAANMASAVYLYVRTLDIDDMFPTIVKHVARAIASWEAVKSRFQGAGPLETLAESLLAVLGVSNLLATLMAPTTFFGFFLSRLRTLERRADGDTALLRFWEAMKAMLSSVRQCILTGSVDPLFFHGRVPSEILFEAESLMVYRNQVSCISEQAGKGEFLKLHSDHKIPHWWSRPFVGQEYTEKVKEVISKLDDALLAVDSSQRSVYINARARLNALVAGLENSLEAHSLRMQALGVVCCGSPGTGKTNLIRDIIGYIGRRNGFTTDASSTYYWLQNVNFQDNLTCHNWAIVHDDADHNTRPATSSQQHHVDGYMATVGNNPQPVESADVSQKGTNMARPLIVLIATNFEDMRLTGFSPEPAAIYRRFPIKLRVRARPEFCYPGSEALDSSLVGNNVDIHSIDILLYEPSSKQYQVHLANQTTRSALKFVGDRFTMNYQSQARLLQRSQVPTCPHCYLPVASVQEGCPACPDIVLPDPVLQGPAASKPFEDAAAAAANAKEISSEVISRNVISKIERACDTVNRLNDVPAAAADQLQTIGMGIKDFLVSWAPYAAILGAVVAGMHLIQSQYPEFQSRVNNSTQVPPPQWVPLNSDKPLVLPFKSTTYTKEDLLTAVELSTGILEVRGEPEKWCHVLRVGHDLFVTTHHSFQFPHLVLQFRGVSYSILPDPSNSRKVGTKDLIVFRVPGVPAGRHCLPYIWPDVDGSISTFDEVMMLHPTRSVNFRRNYVASESVSGYSGQSLYYDPVTLDGDCGLPLIAKMGSAYRIVALHHVLGTMSTGPLITASEIKMAGEAILASFQMGSIVREAFGTDFDLVELKGPQSSELSLAIQNGASVQALGHLRSTKKFSSSKSKCSNSLIYQDVEPLARSILGVEHPYRVPTLKGRMIDGRWRSGYQNIFDHFSHTDSVRWLYAPIRDYLRDLHDLDVSGYAALSEDEAVRGLDNSIINPLNLSTSIGPPLSGPKTQGYSYAGFISPTVRAQLDAIQACVDADEIPIVLSSLGYKDEPVKKAKAEAADIRTINNMCAAFNVYCKRYFAPIKAFFRANPGYFESAVGIDMTLDGGQRIYDRFSVADPTLTSVVEGDFKKMDKTINGPLSWAVAEVFCAVAEAIGVDSRVVRLLVYAQFNVIYSIQGDLFHVGSTNPSGSDITVEINAVANSIVQRGAWFLYYESSMTVDEYKSSSFPLLDFRRSNSLVTFGDDFLLCHVHRLDLTRLFSLFLPFGMIVTDGQKLDKPVYRPLSACTFLKRRFFIQDGKVYCGLIVDSILRMLLINKPSHLSAKEHAAITCEEAIREIFLNRYLNFDEWRQFLRGVADRHNLWDSKYLVLGEFAYYQTKFDDRSLRFWSLDADPSMPETLNPAPTLLQMSNSLPITSAMGGESVASEAIETVSNLPVVTSSHLSPGPNTYGSIVAGGQVDGSITHSTGNILSSTAPVKAGTTGIHHTDQPMASATLGDFLQRNVSIGYMSNLNVPGVVHYNPWRLWMSDSTISDKLANFNYISGSLVVSGKLIAPPLSSGLAVITFCPTYQAPGAYEIPIGLMLTLPHVVVDFSTSSDFEITLPWMTSSNWGSLDDTFFADSWGINVRILTPLATSVPGGCVSAALRIFARAGDDLQLAGPQFQSARSGGSVRTSSRQTRGSQPRDRSGAGDNAFAQDVSQTIVEKTGYKASQIFTGSSYIAGMLSAVTTAVPQVSAGFGLAAAGLGTVGAILSSYGFTRTREEKPPIEALVKPVSSLTHCDEKDPSRSVSLLSANNISIDPAVSGGMSSADEASFEFINSRYGYLGMHEYTVGKHDFTEDLIIPVTPYIGIFNSPTEYQPIPAGYTGAKFVHWVGSMKYLFIPVLSATDRGSLQFVWQPHPDSSSINTDLTNVSINSIVDVTSARPVEVVVGYNNDNPACYSDYMALDTPLTGADYNAINGYLRVRAVVPFSSTICGEKIEMHVFACAGPDMKFFAPSDTIVIEGDVLSPSDYLVQQTLFQMAGVATVGAAGQELTVVELVPMAGPYPVGQNLAGEEVNSVRALCQKPSPMCSNMAENTRGASNGWADGDRAVLCHGPFPYEAVVSSTNWFNFYGRQFLGYAGSVRYKLVSISREPDVTPLDHMLTIAPYSSYSFGAARSSPLLDMGASVVDDTTIQEVDVPYYHNELFVPAYKSHDRVNVLFNPNTRDTIVDNTSVAVFASAGQDARWVFYRGPCCFVIRPTPYDDFPTPFEPWQEDVGAREGVKLSSSKDVNLPPGYRARTGRTVLRHGRTRPSVEPAEATLL